MHTRSSRVAEVVRISGPLAPYMSGFKAALADSCYPPLSTVNQLRLVGHLSCWLESERLCVRAPLHTHPVTQSSVQTSADSDTDLLRSYSRFPKRNAPSTGLAKNVP